MHVCDAHTHIQKCLCGYRPKYCWWLYLDGGIKLGLYFYSGNGLDLKPPQSHAFRVGAFGR